MTERTLAVARAALAVTPLIRKGRAWLYLHPKSGRLRFFANETIAHLIAQGEAVRLDNVVRKLSVCLCVASIVWSCVMPVHARPIPISITKLSRMSAAERLALDNPHLQEPKRAIVTVPVSSLPASTQAALISIMLIRLTHADTSARTIGIPEQSRSAPLEG